MQSSAPPGWNSVIPRLVVLDVAELVQFIKEVFAAEGDYLDDRPAILQIGDSKIMVSGVELREPVSAFLYVYVDDVESTYQRALRAGATSIEAPRDLPYGDRRAMIKDRWGNLWQIACYQGHR
jgi:uncharacterized glyoxalase superfamily protein PhnB